MAKPDAVFIYIGTYPIAKELNVSAKDVDTAVQEAAGELS